MAIILNAVPAQEKHDKWTAVKSELSSLFSQFL